MPSKATFIPIIIFFGFPTTFLITYGWSVALDHVYPILPTISDTGTLPPESCLFSMMLNLIAATLTFAIYIRHKEINEIFRAKGTFDSRKYAPMVNRVATIIGLVACIGLDLVANFQETNVLVVHGLGAMICFWSSAAYIIIQTILSYWVVPEMHGVAIVIFRGILGLCSIFGVSMNMAAQTIASNQFAKSGEIQNQTVILKWDPSQAGYKWHVTSSIAEWFNVLIIGTFILTYYWDFRKITIHPPELVMHSDPVVKSVSPKRFTQIGTES